MVGLGGAAGRWTGASLRPQTALTLTLFGLAAVAWVASERRMFGMSTTPAAGLGGVGLSLTVWVTMMAAMMFPSVAPMIVVYDRLRAARRTLDGGAPGPAGTALFVGGYLVAWTLAGLGAFVAVGVVAALDVRALAWERAGREVAAGIVLAAGLYQLTPAKDRCLTRCRGPFSFVLEHWRRGHAGAVRMGMIHGGWCVGCCWALMAALFALGLMSLGWMAFVAGLIALEKLLPWKRAANVLVAVALVAVGIALLVAPGAVPGTPAGGAGMEM